MKNKIYEIIHVGAFGPQIGGVESMFKNYLFHSNKNIKYKHSVWINSNVSCDEISLFGIKAYRKRLILLFLTWFPRRIIIWHNNLGSRTLKLLLQFGRSGRVILYEHGTAWNANDSEINIYRNNLKSADLVIVNSEATKNYLHRRFSADLIKLKVVYYGIPFKEPADTFKYSDKLIVGYIGRLQYFKGIHILIKAFLEIDNENIELWIAGIGNFEDHIRKLADNNNNIKFLGLVKNTDEFYPKVDIVVVPSIREPFGAVIIEAGSYSKPVIASSIDGIPEIITNGVDGILLGPKKMINQNLYEKNIIVPKLVVSPDTGDLIPPKEIDPIELAESMIKLLKNNDMMSQLGKNLHEKVKNKYTIKTYSDNLDKIFKGHFDKLERCKQPYNL